MEYSQVQNIAKQTINYIKTVIRPGMNLIYIRKMCEEKMIELGADSFWYWDVGAFCFSGNETIVSVSGKSYVTSDKIIESNDIVTIDLSPQCDNIWGDYARTIILENGIVLENVNDIVNSEWKYGLLMEEELHEEMKQFVTKKTTFEQLYFHMNEYIIKSGCINLDFMGI